MECRKGKLWDNEQILSYISHWRVAKDQKIINVYDNYLTTIKQLVDNLQIAEKTINRSDLATQVLSGLDKEYTPIVVQLNNMEDISWDEYQVNWGP